uniref:Uncharacterized protein n=1 Tax=Lepeophtheirus salmonis TaxID=72036 RepID=A0A0K2V6U8_LEPSM
MTLECYRRISICALQVVGRLQDHRLCNQKIRNVRLSPEELKKRT